jgi:hypothetical protein
MHNNTVRLGQSLSLRPTALAGAAIFRTVLE